jgi:hypothetical protein
LMVVHEGVAESSYESTLSVTLGTLHHATDSVSNGMAHASNGTSHHAEQ